MTKSVMAAALCVGTLAGASLADQVTLNPSKDNTLFEEVNGATSNGAGPNVFVGNTLQNSARRALLGFDFSSIPAGSTITNVSLTMFMAQTNGGSTRVTIHRVSNSWGEGTSNSGPTGGNGADATPGDATWLHREFSSLLWTTPGGDFEASESASKDVAGINFYTWTSTDLASDVQSWLDNPSSNYGWLLMADEVTPATAKRFISREGAIASQRPSLTITYTPVPAPAGVAALAGMLVLGARRRRR